MIDQKAIVDRKREPVMIGNHLVDFTPHYLPGVGPRVMVPGSANLYPAPLASVATACCYKRQIRKL